MNIPDTLRYTKSHEWVRTEPDGTLTVGITDFAQDSLGELVFLELPQAGRRLAAGEECAVVESVKAASDIYCPVAGVVIESNPALADEPGRVNKDPYGSWLFRLKPEGAADAAKLLDAGAYRGIAGSART
jgi:glycine cleavage system H protein